MAASSSDSAACLSSLLPVFSFDHRNVFPFRSSINLIFRHRKVEAVLAAIHHSKSLCLLLVAWPPSCLFDLALKLDLNWFLGRHCAKNRPWPCYTSQLSQNSCVKGFWNHFKTSQGVAEQNIVRKVGSGTMLHDSKLVKKSRVKSWIVYTTLISLFLLPFFVPRWNIGPSLVLSLIYLSNIWKCFPLPYQTQNHSWPLKISSATLDQSLNNTKIPCLGWPRDCWLPRKLISFEQDFSFV